MTNFRDSAEYFGNFSMRLLRRGGVGFARGEYRIGDLANNKFGEWTRESLSGQTTFYDGWVQQFVGAPIDVGGVIVRTSDVRRGREVNAATHMFWSALNAYLADGPTALNLGLLNEEYENRYLYRDGAGSGYEEQLNSGATLAQMTAHHAMKSGTRTLF